MDLREVLAAALAANCIGPNTGCGDLRPHMEDASTVLARLSQPDVLDEFERRVNERGFGKSEWCWATAEEARRVLSDMLGGGE